MDILVARCVELGVKIICKRGSKHSPEHEAFVIQCS